MNYKKNNKAKSIVIANGNAAILDSNGEIGNSPIGALRDDQIILPSRSVNLSQTRDILINSGVIRFEENKAFLNFAIQESTNKTIMSLLGKAAEAVIVKRCFEAEEVNYRLFCIATGKRARKETAKQFEACGTSLIQTKVNHRRHYNPQDTQRDIIFINANDKVAFMSNATSVAGECAGLQIKTSNDIVNYLIRDIISGRYCVPIVCFPLMGIPDLIFGITNIKQEILCVNIYDMLIRKIKNSKYYINELLKNNPLYFDDYLSSLNLFESRLFDYLKGIVYDIKEIDMAAFEELLSIKIILEFLVAGRISPDDLLQESEVLKSCLMSLGLRMVSPSVESNNILVPIF